MVWRCSGWWFSICPQEGIQIPPIQTERHQPDIWVARHLRVGTPLLDMETKKKPFGARLLTGQLIYSIYMCIYIYIYIYIYICDAGVLFEGTCFLILFFSSACVTGKGKRSPCCFLQKMRETPTHVPLCYGRVPIEKPPLGVD